MKIAQIAPLAEAVPPKLYGGTERIVAYLTDALVELGHDVTLYASGDSETSAKLEPVWPRALRLDPEVRDYIAPHFIMLEKVAARAHDFDIIHIHCDYLAFPLLSRVGVPIVTTLHGRLDLPELRPLYECYPNVPVVSISNSQRGPLPEANFVSTVYHGVSDKHLHFGNGDKGYLAFIGRISPEKGPEAAIRIAKAAGMKLRIAAKVDRVDQAYFNERVEPLIRDNPDVEFIGEIAEHQKTEFLSNAAALIFPIAWREPFGLVMIESMACGTPVIATRWGSVPEVIEEGVTGFIVDSEEQAVAATRKIGSLDRRRIREVFDAKYSSKRMAENYVKLFERLIDEHKRQPK